MRFVDEMSNQEIGLALGLTGNKVAERIAYALKLLRKKCKDDINLLLFLLTNYLLSLFFGPKFEAFYEL